MSMLSNQTHPHVNVIESNSIKMVRFIYYNIKFFTYLHFCQAFTTLTSFYKFFSKKKERKEKNQHWIIGGKKKLPMIGNVRINLLRIDV